MVTDACVPGYSASRTRCGALAGLVTALCVVGLASPSHALGNFTKQITITVGAGVVGTLTDFPLLVDVSNGELRTVANSGQVQSANGHDIVFWSDDPLICGGPTSCMLDHEIELYDGVTNPGRVVAWVRVPSLANGRYFYMDYGNNQITSSTEATGAVFDADYVGVWHLKELGSAKINEYRDSSRYGNHGQGGQGAANATPARVTAKIGYGQHFIKATDNIADFIDAGQDGSMNITGNQITLEGWVNHDVSLTYSSGTATVAAGGTVVTFTGATLPAWLQYDDYIEFPGPPGPPETLRIASRDSATQLTLQGSAQLDHTDESYTIRPGSIYGVVNHKGYYDGYRLYLSAGQAACPSPSGALTDPCLGFAVPGQSDQLASSQYGSPATDPVTRGFWHHVVGTYDNAEMKLYVDGQKLLAVGGMGNHTLDDGWCNPGGCAQIAAGPGGTVMTLDHNLPAGVAAGNVVTFDTRSATGPAENLLIQSVDSLTQVTVATGAAYDHSFDQSFTISSSFKTGNISPSMAEQHVWIGHADQQQNVGWSSPWVGDLDEVRISRVARSAGWIQTEYNNQNNPGPPFYTVTGPVGVTQFLPTFTTVYRSIGTRPNYGTVQPQGNGTNVSAVQDSAVVTGVGGTTWSASNRGQGDGITIPCPDVTCTGGVDYTVLSVDSDGSLRLTTPFTGLTGTYSYRIRRKFASPRDWESCIDGNSGLWSAAACENVSTSYLVADNRSEVGILYADGSAYTPIGVNPIVNFAPACLPTCTSTVTDPRRSVTLTVAPANRHRGVPDVGNARVVLDNTGNTVPAVQVQMDHVTLERLEIKGGTGAEAHGIELASVNPANLGVVRYNLIHDTQGDGIRLSDADSIVDIYNNFIFNTNVGIRLLVDMNPAARVNIFHNTVYNSTAAGIASRDAVGAYVRQTSLRVTLRQNIAHSSPVNSDFDIARAFDEAYFCTDDPPTAPNCTNITAQVGDRSVNYQLPFASATTCLYVGSTHRFRGVGASVVAGGAYNPNLAWDYWNGTATAWTSLATQIPAFRSHDLQWDGFAYWPDELSDWAPRTLNGGASLYYVRACGYYTYTNGYASVDLGGTTVTFSDNLPAVVGAGDTLFFTGGWTGTPETLTIASRDDDTHVTVTTPAAFDHSGGDTFGIPDASFGPTEELITRADVSVASRYNLARDLTGYYGSLWHGVGITGLQDSTGTGVQFTSATDLHILTGSIAKDALLDTQRNDGGWESSALTARFLLDVDYQARPPGPNGDCIAKGATCWDIGADEYGPATAVRLMSFGAVPGDGSVTLEWRTGSELDNLGFHVYRGASADGPWTRLTSSLIPGLGSSPLGQAYSWLDSGLVNGQRYYYRLEDVDTASVSTFHGPVSAMPEASTPPPPGGGGGGGGGEPGGGTGPGGSTGTSCPAWVLAAAPEVLSPTCTKHGDPESVSLDVLSRDASSATLELRTGGFWALREPSGTVRVFVPGFDFPTEARAAALPLRRALVDAVVGKQVQLVSAEALDLRGFRGLRPSAVGQAEMNVSRDGTVRPARRSLAAPLLSRGFLPQQVARLAGTVFQGERKSAVVEITPVRFYGSRQELVLAGRVRVKLAFTGIENGEIGTGSRGRALPRQRSLFREVLAQVHTSGRGLYGVSYDALFPERRRGFSTLFLRLQRQGEVVPFHVEPAGWVFGPGSVLYFFADRTATSTEYSGEVAYELVRSAGRQMGVVLAHPVGAPVGSSSTGFASFETNRNYQAGLLEAPDIWLWETMASGVAKTKAFTLLGVDTASSEVARLVVYLQGGSESGVTADHHVRVSVNGGFVGEATFAGKQAYRLDVLVPASLLREGANELQLVNVGDTGVSSLVFLDKFSLSYPQAASVRGGVFEGVWGEGGTAEVSGLSGSPIVIEVTGAATADVARNDIAGTSPVKWVTGFEAAPGVVRFEAEAGRRYLVVSPGGVLSPRIAQMAPSTLREGTNQADYLVVGPSEFLEAAVPLLERRRSQGLVSRAVSFEEIASEFGKGQPSAEAIKAFLSYAYHSWQRPSPRYVLLLGDSTYDPQRFVASSWASPLPALWAKTSYLWTASDPALAAVNGEDLLPDLAIGRLPATTVAEAEALVGKLLAWEDSGQGLLGKAVLVADNPDEAGDFEADVEDVRASFLAGRPTTTLKVGELGGATRPAILGAFDDGASLMSYVGHGGAAVWASENVLNSWDTPSLQAQSQQPLLLTMNCLNGYFVAPNFDALSEALLKAEGRGAVAAFSPSGLSLDGPAHQYHRAVMKELTSGTHERLGDAILAAQRDYAQTGLMPELLSVYQLLGDPAMKLR